MSEQQTSKHGPLQDEELKHATRGLEQGGHPTHAEEWRDPEPPGEDQPDAGQILSGTRQGTAPGMTEEDVEERSEIARFLGISAFPGDRDALVAVAAENEATDHVLAELRRLPAGRTFQNVQEVSRALGHGGETHRT
jgi:hypothetical protein